MGSKKLSDAQIERDRTSSVMRVIAKRAGYYRKNLDKFCYDYLGITNLKWFQKILLWIMDRYDNTMFVGCRGIGKTYICALFVVCRCILYPGELCLTVSATYKQAKNMIEKVTNDFMLKSPLLRSEIDKYSVGQNDCYIRFKNGSLFRAITATESSRGYRSHIILVDESRLIPSNIVSSILRPMNAVPRQPGYLSKTEYSELVEMPKELYLSSAWYSMSEMYTQAQSYFENMLDPNLSYYIIDLPYQVSIKEGLLMKQQIINEQSEATFSDIIFMMEREGRFYGSSDNALFDYRILDKQRTVGDCLFNLDYYNITNQKIPEKKNEEIRILSLDIALLASKKHDNDASAFILHSGVPTSTNEYIDNILNIDTCEGLTTEELGLETLRRFYQYDCDYLAIDANGVGQSVLDYIMGADRYDPLYNETYGALNVMNNPDLEDRCKVKNAPKVVYAIKANARSNNDMTLALRAGFQNGYINLLISDTNVEEKLSKIRGYGKLSDVQQARMKMPYVQTTLLINELINLTHDTSNGLIKVKERTGMRKDRYSSVQYGYALLQELSKGLRPKTNTTTLLDQLSIRRGSYNGRTI